MDGGQVIVRMLPCVGEYLIHGDELFETDGEVYAVCGTACYRLKGYGLFTVDMLEVVAG